MLDVDNAIVDKAFDFTITLILIHWHSSLRFLVRI